MKVAAVTLVKTSRELRVPTLVMFAWAASVTLWAVPTVLTLAPLMFEIPEPFDAMSNPWTVRPVRVPTDVIFACAAAVTLWAVPTVLTLAPLMFEIPEPFEATSNPLTVKPDRVPTDVMLGCAAAVTLEATLAAATFPTKFEELMFERPEAFPVKRPPAKTPETVRFTRVPKLVIFDWVFES